MPRFCALILFGLAWGFDLTVARGAQTPDWSRVHHGMEAAAVIEVVGEPLFKTGGKVYQTWIYDRAGEIVLAGGVVVAFTPPKVAAEAKDVAVRAQTRTTHALPIG